MNQALDNSIVAYRKWYPFTNVYLVSDSREKSWRKSINSEYKANRKKDSDIDWEFVYDTYNSFKKKLKGVKVLESPGIEGDDWISFIINETNKLGHSNVVISNDHDIKQLLAFDTETMWINFMTNEMYNQQKLFLPKNYQIFIDKINKLPNDDIFALNDNKDFLDLFSRFRTKYETFEISSVESLITKVISGDISDNISSVYEVTKNGKTRGIGSKGADTILNSYIMEFGDISLQDPDLYENIADIICEKKKASKSTIPNIIERVEQNLRLIDLRIEKLPTNIVDKMRELYV